MQKRRFILEKATVEICNFNHTYWNFQDMYSDMWGYQDKLKILTHAKSVDWSTIELIFIMGSVYFFHLQNEPRAASRGCLGDSPCFI